MSKRTRDDDTADVAESFKPRLVRTADADGEEFINEAAVKGDVSYIGVPEHCTDFSTVSQPGDLLSPPPPTVLTEEQIAHFEEHGYVSNIRVLSKAAVDLLRADCDAIAAGHEARGLLYEFHSNQSGDPRNVLMHALGHWRVTPAFHALAYQPTLCAAAATLLGGVPIRLFHDQLFCKPAKHGGGVAWHQDYSYWTRTEPMNHITVHVALDDQTADNGPLSFIPGSHKWARADGKPGPLPITDANFADANSIQRVLSPEQRAAFKPVPLTLKKGEASFHHGLAIHGSGPNRSDGPRRAAVLNYFGDGTLSATDEPLLAGVPVVKRGEPIRGRFFPLVYDPRAQQQHQQVSAAQSQGAASE